MTINNPPPAIYEPTVRLVYSDLGLAELFCSTANKLGMKTELLHPEDVAEQVAKHLDSLPSKEVSIAESKLLRQLDLKNQLRHHIHRSTGISPLPGDAGPGADTPAATVSVITGCIAAVAETGSLVFQRSPGFALPTNAIVILEPKNFVADLIDLFDRHRETPQDMVLISGPNQFRVFVLN